MKKIKRKKLGFVISPFFIILAIFWIYFGDILLFFSYFLALVLHELAHKFTAKKCGYKAGRIVLSPLGATLYAETDEFSAKDEFIIALSGPLFSLCLALIMVVLWWIIPESYNYTMDFVVVNFSIFLLNLLPIYPLDGGRVLASRLTQSMQRKEVGKILRTLSDIFAAILIGLSLISFAFKFNYSYALIGCFVIINNLTSTSENSYKRLLYLEIKRKKLSKGLFKQTVMVNQDVAIGKVFSMLEVDRYFEIEVVDESFKKIATISENEFFEKIKTCEFSMPIGAACIDKVDNCW